ncbi:MAG: MopE-related protein, partial [Nanoarchaeota archaeon]
MKIIIILAICLVLIFPIVNAVNTPLMLVDLENIDISNLQYNNAEDYSCGSSAIIRISNAWGGILADYQLMIGHTPGTHNTDITVSDGNSLISMAIKLATNAGEYVTLTYDSGTTLDVYLPFRQSVPLAVTTCQQALTLYIASDGSTYYDKELTNLAQSAPVNNELCYQESADTATTCGGLGTGSYTCENDWTQPCSNGYDGDWSTSAAAMYGDLFVNYYKPDGALSGIWQVKDAIESKNFTLPSSCSSQNPIKLLVHSQISQGTHVGYYCWDGTAWQLQGSGGGTPAFYEEAMWWSDTEDPCIGVTCNNNYCNGNTRYYNGGCSAGTCDYQTEECSFGCNNGECISELIDQQQTSSSDSWGHAIYQSRKMGQSFKPSISGKITKTELYIKKGGSPSNALTVSIKDSPYGSVLASTSLQPSEFSTGFNWETFDFPDTDLTKDTTYYIIAYTSRGDTDNEYRWAKNDNNPYSGGNAWSSLSSDVSSVDMTFKIWMKPKPLDCQPGSGSCCDADGFFRNSNYKCGDNVATDYGCPWGTGKGDDVGAQHQDQYCSGSSAECTGNFEWDGWSVHQSCSDLQVCIDDNPNCVSIACSDAADCGTDGWINQLTCQNNDVYDNYRTYTCNNPGTTSSSCSNGDESRLKEDCGDTTYGSWSSNYCSNGDVIKSRDVYNKGCSNGGCTSSTSTETEVINDCQYGCENAACVVLACISNSDCGTDGWIGDTSCNNEDIWQNYKTYTCNNPSTSNAYCSDSTNSKLKEDCNYECAVENGQAKCDLSNNPLNPGVHLGDTLIWSYEGYYGGSDTINEFNSSLADILENCAADDSGFCTIPVKFSSDSAGLLDVSGLRISYTLKDIPDCENGQTQLCPKQSGVCSNSFETCSNGEFTGCTDSDYSSYSSSYETEETNCDNLDNDCDGQVDEGFEDLDNDNTADCIDDDLDNDGIPDDEDDIIGKADDINFIGETRDIKIYMEDGKEDEHVKTVRINNSNKPLIEFNYNFSKGNIKLRNLTIEKQKDEDSAGFTLVKGLNLKGHTKSVFVDKLVEGSNSVCVKDKYVSKITEVTDDCSGAQETLLTCEFSTPTGENTLACYFNEQTNQYMITELKHSAVTEQRADSDGDSYYYVALDGNDESGDSSISAPWRHIQYAVDQAVPGSTIFLLGSPATYEELLNITKNITLIGEGVSDTTIKQPGSDSVTEPIITSTADLALFNLTVGSGLGWEETVKGVYITGGRLTLNDVAIRNIFNYAVVATNSIVNISDITLNITYGPSDIGIKLINSTGIIEHIQAGTRFDHIIDLLGNSSAVIRYNVLNGSNTLNANGIRLRDDSTAVIENNIIDGWEEYGDLPRWRPQAGVQVGDDSFIQLRNNTIKNFAKGVSVLNLAKVNASYNKIIDNVVDGIWLSAWENPDVDFGGGIYSSPGMNTIQGNKNASVYHGNTADVSMKYNYWGTASCSEINKTFDYYDGSSRRTIYYEPFLDVPYPFGNLTFCAPNCTDADGDGFSQINSGCGVLDCDDTYANINPSATEICDNIDNNCDGNVDEDYISSATSCGTGACQATGTLLCVNGEEQDSCTPETPTVETCNNIDDDCDNEVDENLVEERSCGFNDTQTFTCANGEWSPSNECLDNGKCNPGQQQARPCGTSDVGVCEFGTQNRTCQANYQWGEWKECIGNIEPVQETCNNIDDDCDGSIDEDYASTPTSCGVGMCAATGYTSCVDGSIVDSCTSGTAADEICDSLDNDCDGSIDEGFDDLDNDGIADCVDDDQDGDGVDDDEDKIIGDEKAIDSNIDDIKIQIGDNEGIGNIPPGLGKVKLRDNDKPVVEFDFDFGNKKLRLNKVKVNKESGEDQRGFTVISGLIDIEGTKTVYVNQLVPTTENVCVKDAEISSVSEMTSACNGAEETLLQCDGVEASGYMCNLNDGRFKITGLKHSGAQEMCQDSDSDSYTSQACGGNDCNDNDAAINPGATETCNNIDDDCDGTIDEGVKNTYYQDSDSDDYGNSDVTQEACSAPDEYVT